MHYQDINSDNQGAFEVDPASLEPAGGRRVASRYHNEPTDIEYRLYSATLDWDLGGVSLQSVTSYSEFLEDFERDVAAIDIGLGFPTAQLLTLAWSTFGTTDRLLSGVQFQNTGTDKFTQEFRLVSPDSDRFEWLVLCKCEERPREPDEEREQDEAEDDQEDATFEKSKHGVTRLARE